MKRRIRKMSGPNLKRMALTVLIILLVGVSAAAFCLIKNGIKENADTYEARIAELEESLRSHNKTIYVAKEYIPKGTEIRTGFLEKKEILSDSEAYADIGDMGSILLVDVYPGSEITKSILRKKQETGEQKKETVIGSIKIGETMEEGDYVDIRLRFPDGTDYIVASKKKLISLLEQEKAASFYLTEEEILFIDSAMTDKKLYEGSELYMTEYVSPESDEPSVVNYIPSGSLEKLIKDNPNIKNISAESLSDTERGALEEKLKIYLSGEEKAVVGKESYEKERNGNGGSIWD